MADNDFSELLPETDAAYLNEKFPTARVYPVGNEVHVVLPAFPFPEAYKPRSSDLLMRLPAGYPDAKPDMFWTLPSVKLLTDAWPDRCGHLEIPGSGPGSEIYNNTPWQRWSRHSNPQDWRPGVDGLRNFVTAIKRELDRQV